MTVANNAQKTKRKGILTSKFLSVINFVYWFRGVLQSVKVWKIIRWPICRYFYFLGARVSSLLQWVLANPWQGPQQNSKSNLYEQKTKWDLKKEPRKQDCKALSDCIITASSTFGTTDNYSKRMGKIKATSKYEGRPKTRKYPSNYLLYRFVNKKQVLDGIWIAFFKTYILHSLLIKHRNLM